MTATQIPSDMMGWSAGKQAAAGKLVGAPQGLPWPSLRGQGGKGGFSSWEGGFVRYPRSCRSGTFGVVTQGSGKEPAGNVCKTGGVESGLVSPLLGFSLQSG